LTALAYGGAMALMSLAPNRATALALGPVLGAASISFLTASTAIVQIEAAPEMRGRVLALQAMLFLGSTPVGGPIVGWVSERFGARYGIGVGAIAALAAGGWGLVRSRRLAADVPIDTQDVEQATADAAVVP
jgi:MFS family permease